MFTNFEIVNLTVKELTVFEKEIDGIYTQHFKLNFFVILYRSLAITNFSNNGANLNYCSVINFEKCHVKYQNTLH